MKPLITFIKYFFLPGFALGVFGQVIWAIIFWNNDAMLTGHWTVAGIGVLWMALGACVAIYQFCRDL